MNRMKLIYSIVFLFVAGSTFATDTKEEFVKKVNKNFKIAADGALSVTHKHGNLNITTWDKNQVDVKVKIIVMATSQSAADKIFERISMDFSSSSKEVAIKTKITSGSSGSWWGGGSWSSNDDFKIEINVQLPKTLKLALSNKYGHTTIPNMNSKIAMTQSYGNVKMGAINGDVALTLKYGNGSVKSGNKIAATLGYGKVSLGMANAVAVTSKYSEIRIKETKKLAATSSYDDYEIGKVGTLTVTGRYDDYEIKEVNQATITGSYTEFDIGFLHTKAIATLKYGDMDIENTGSNLESIIYTGSYADLTVGMDGKKPSKLVVKASYGDVSMPSGMKSEVIESGNSKKVNATHAQGKGKIVATVKYADVEVN